MVQRHVFKPDLRSSVDDQQNLPRVAALKGTRNSMSTVFPLFLGIFSLLLSLIPVCIGIYEFKQIQKPSDLALARFDALFRKAGSLLPFIPFALRCLIQIPGKGEPKGQIPSFFRWLPGVALHVGIQAVRLALYQLHVLGQQHDFVAGDLLADHCVLGVAVQTALAFEIAAATCMVATSSSALMAASTYTVSATTAWLMLVLVSFDMRDTSKYFHHAEESLLGVIVGALVFALPMCYLLLTPLLQQKQPVRQNGRKSV